MSTTMMQREQHLQIGTELFNAADLESIHCPGCRNHIDVAKTGHINSIIQYIEHVNSCTGEDTAEFRHGFIYINDQIAGKETLQPKQRPEEPWSHDVDTIHNHFDNHGWSAEKREEEGIVVVTGPVSDKYSVDTSGNVYGDGPANHLVRQCLNKL